MRPQQLSTTLFPYTTLFRSLGFLSVAGRPILAAKDEVNQRQGHVGAHPTRAAFKYHSSPTHPHSPSGHLQLTLILDRKSTRLNSSHVEISYAVFCLKKKKIL